MLGRELTAIFSDIVFGCKGLSVGDLWPDSEFLGGGMSKDLVRLISCLEVEREPCPFVIQILSQTPMVVEAQRRHVKRAMMHRDSVWLVVEYAEIHWLVFLRPLSG